MGRLHPACCRGVGARESIPDLMLTSFRLRHRHFYFRDLAHKGTLTDQHPAITLNPEITNCQGVPRDSTGVGWRWCKGLVSSGLVIMTAVPSAPHCWGRGHSFGIVTAGSFRGKVRVVCELSPRRQPVPSFPCLLIAWGPLRQISRDEFRLPRS